MSKRTPGLERRPNDLYDTIDPNAVKAVLPHLARHTRFIEPCVGGGVLQRDLERFGHVCLQAYDIAPTRPGIERRDALEYVPEHSRFSFITNPPWTREILHPLILHLSEIADTWLLFDADWAFTGQALPFMRRCRKIVSAGRLKWIPETTMKGKDNCAWYLFGKPDPYAPTLFLPNFNK